MTDQLVECRHCGHDACYESKTDNIIGWQCMDCGFYTNTMMLQGGEMVKFIKETSPELIRDLLFEDNSGLVWAPRILNKPGIGIIFPSGPNAKDWFWTFAPEVPVPEGQKERFPVKGKPGEFHKTKVSTTEAQHFGQADFILALQAANLLNTI